MQTYQEPLGDGIACYSDASGKLEMVGFQDQNETQRARNQLTQLVLEGTKRLNIPCCVEFDQDHECLRIVFDQKATWGLLVYEATGTDEDIDGTIRHYPAFNIWSFYRTPNLGQLEETQITKGTHGMCSALRVILKWLYYNITGDVVEGVVQAIAPKE